MKYTVDVTQTRTYAVRVRVANVGSGATFRIKIDDDDVTGPVPVPNTGGWDVWSTVSIPDLALTQGPHQVSLILMSRNAENNGVGNYGYLEFR